MSGYNDYDSFGNNNANRNTYDGYDSGVNYYGNNSDSVGIGTWILIFIGLGIPLVNIVLLFFIAFGAHNESLKNFGKASLIIMGIGVVLAFLFGGCGMI